MIRKTCVALALAALLPAAHADFPADSSRFSIRPADSGS